MVVIDIVRHAEGFHNLCKENHQMQDALLTPKGEEQCRGLSAVYPYGDKLKMLIASPLRRTLQTCLLTFGAHAAPGTVVVAVPELQEVSAMPADVGSEASSLLDMFGADTVDVSRVHAGWNNKGPGTPYEPTVKAVEKRALAARRILRELTAHLGEDDHVAVVSHGAFLLYLTEDFTGVIPARFTSWENVEMRSYVFVDPTGADANATLRETAESRDFRNVYAKTDYYALFEDRMAAFEAEGRNFHFST